MVQPFLYRFCRAITEKMEFCRIIQKLSAPQMESVFCWKVMGQKKVSLHREGGSEGFQGLGPGRLKRRKER